MIPRNFQVAASRRPVDTMAFPRFDTATIEKNIRKVLGTKKRKLAGINIPENKFVQVMDLCFEDYRALGHRHFISGRTMGILEVRAEMMARMRPGRDPHRNRSIFRFRMTCQKTLEWQQRRANKLGCCEEEKAAAGACLRCERGICACMTPLPLVDTLGRYIDTVCANALSSRE